MQPLLKKRKVADADAEASIRKPNNGIMASRRQPQSLRSHHHRRKENLAHRNSHADYHLQAVARQPTIVPIPADLSITASAGSAFSVSLSLPTTSPALTAPLFSVPPEASPPFSTAPPETSTPPTTIFSPPVMLSQEPFSTASTSHSAQTTDPSGGSAPSSRDPFPSARITDSQIGPSQIFTALSVEPTAPEPTSISASSITETSAASSAPVFEPPILSGTFPGNFPGIFRSSSSEPSASSAPFSTRSEAGASSVTAPVATGAQSVEVTTSSARPSQTSVGPSRSSSRGNSQPSRSNQAHGASETTFKTTTIARHHSKAPSTDDPDPFKPFKTQALTHKSESHITTGSTRATRVYAPTGVTSASATSSTTSLVGAAGVATSNSGHVSTSVVVGSVVGGIAGVAVVSLFAFVLLRFWKRKKQSSPRQLFDEPSDPPRSMSYATSQPAPFMAAPVAAAAQPSVRPQSGFEHVSGRKLASPWSPGTGAYTRGARSPSPVMSPTPSDHTYPTAIYPSGTSTFPTNTSVSDYEAEALMDPFADPTSESLAASAALGVGLAESGGMRTADGRGHVVSGLVFPSPARTFTIHNPAAQAHSSYLASPEVDPHASRTTLNSMQGQPGTAASRASKFSEDM